MRQDHWQEDVLHLRELHSLFDLQGVLRPWDAEPRVEVAQGLAPPLQGTAIPHGTAINEMPCRAADHSSRAQLQLTPMRVDPHRVAPMSPVQCKGCNQVTLLGRQANYAWCTHCEGALREDCSAINSLTSYIRRPLCCLRRAVG